MVANLAEEIVHRIGGNPILVRAGALYHDIGKSVDPQLFVENQAGGISPHSQYDFAESAQHIISHVTHGVALAQKHKLPEAVIDFIRTHHGRGKVKYFYNSHKNAHPDEPIDESLFTYAGPDPISKECAVLMMADAVEAASRSLPEKTEENITKLVNDIIDTQVKDGRFENANITFKEISIAKKTCIDILVSMYHARMAYPKLNKEDQEEESNNNPAKA
jgi:putative nucleotidyltransferase with HDIG domain